MTVAALPAAKFVHVLSDSVAPPPPWAEYVYYLILVNSVFGLSLLSAPLVGAAMMAILAAFLIVRLGPHATTVYAPVSLLIACAISSVIIQVIFHNESLTAPDNRYFITWTFGLIIVQSLASRQGFFHRFALVIFGIALVLVLHLNMDFAGPEQRAGLDLSVGYANPSDLAAWFGFCCVYFIVRAVESNRQLTRIMYFLVACGAVFVLGLTVSRGPLIATGIGGVVALRRLLRRGFIPILLLMIVASGMLGSGLFDHVISRYSERASEETGRFLIWPIAIEEIFNSPLIGVGISNQAVWVPEKGEFDTVHNGLLYFPLLSGIIPALLYVGVWIRLTRGAVHAISARLSYAQYLIPLVIYLFLVNIADVGPIMAPWAILTMVTATSASILPIMKTGIASPRNRKPWEKSRVIPK
jgi:O-antigen ligase